MADEYGPWTGCKHCGARSGYRTKRGRSRWWVRICRKCDHNYDTGEMGRRKVKA